MKQIELYCPIKKPQHTAVPRKEYARLKRVESAMDNLKCKAAIMLYSSVILTIGVLSGIGFVMLAR